MAVMRSTILTLCTLFLAAAVLMLAGCGERPVYQQQSYVFGTLVEVSVYGVPKEKARPAVDRVLRAFDTMHRRFHAWEPSELERLNTAFAKGPDPVPIAPDLAGMLQDATRFSLQSDGLFNPAIGNLIRLWGFQSDTFKARLPPEDEIRRLVRDAPAMTDIVIRDGRAMSRNPAVRLDLGGYAKGYALDRAAAILHQAGIENALVNIGGNIIALGRHGDRPWHVGIQDPRKPGAMADLDLYDGEAIGTSGDYQRYFELNGKRYCHIIDPRTGWPAQGMESVTVLTHGARAGVRSDVLSKPLFIAGPAGWRAMAKKIGVADALVVEAGGRVGHTGAMARRIHSDEQGGAAKVVP